jgi:hypothetical protein
MKRVVLVAAVAMLSLASCKKDYVCTIDLPIFGEVETDYKDLTSSEAKDGKSDCESVSGVWSVK